MTEEQKELLRQWLEKTAELAASLELSSTVPPKGSPQQVADWSKSRLEEIAATRGYFSFYLENLEFAWAALHRHLHKAQRELVTVEVLPAKKPSTPRQRKESNDLEKTLRESKLDEEKKREVARILGISY